MSDRDLAEAIYREMVSAKTVVAALDLWQCRHIGHSDRYDMSAVLATITRHAIDRVLARRQSEAARTGPWEGGHHFQEEDGYPGSLLPPKRGTP